MATATICPISQVDQDSGPVAAPGTGFVLLLTTNDGKLAPFMSADVYVQNLNGQFTYAFGLNSSEAVKNFITFAATNIKVIKRGNRDVPAFGVDMIT